MRIFFSILNTSDAICLLIRVPLLYSFIVSDKKFQKLLSHSQFKLANIFLQFLFLNQLFIYNVLKIYFPLNDYILTGINETESTIVITSHDLLPKFKTLLPQMPKVRVIVYMEDQLQATNTDGFKEDVQILPYKEVIRMGSTSKVQASPPSVNDVAIIMYTSGSTGTPKGVLLLHENCIATLKGFVDAIQIFPGDILLG